MNSIYKHLHAVDTARHVLVLSANDADNGNEAISAKKLKEHVNTLYRKSKELYADVKEYVGMDVDTVTANQVDLNKAVLRAKYTNLRNKIVYKPLAFTGDVKVFTELLVRSKDDVLSVKDTITASIVLFSGYTSEVEELTKLSSKRLPQFAELTDTLEEFKLFFGGSEGVDRDTLGNLYRNLADYRTASDNIIDLSKDFKGHNVKSLRADADKLYDIMEILEKELDSKHVKLSPASARNIGNCLYSVSEALAFYSLYITKLISVSNSQRDTAAKLNSFI